MNHYRVEATHMDIPANRISRYIPKGQATTPWEAITSVFYPGGQPANCLPLGSYYVTVYINGMDQFQTSIYRFN